MQERDSVREKEFSQSEGECLHRKTLCRERYSVQIEYTERERL